MPAKQIPKEIKAQVEQRDGTLEGAMRAGMKAYPF